MYPSLACHVVMSGESSDDSVSEDDWPLKKLRRREPKTLDESDEEYSCSQRNRRTKKWNPKRACESLNNVVLIKKVSSTRRNGKNRPISDNCSESTASSDNSDCNNEAGFNRPERLAAAPSKSNQHYDSEDNVAQTDFNLKDANSSIELNQADNSIKNSQKYAFNNSKKLNVQTENPVSTELPLELSEKKQGCKFCLKCVFKLPRHLQLKHAEEPEVARFLALPKRSLQRRQIMNKIRNEGNYTHNKDILGEKTKNSISEQQNVSESKSVSCPKCFTKLKENYLPRHLKKCFVQEGDLDEVDLVQPKKKKERETIKEDKVRLKTTGPKSIKNSSGKRTVPMKKWAKKQCCKFCSKYVQKLPRHLLLKHSMESEVLIFSSLPKGSVERRGLIDKIRNEGNFMHNRKLLGRNRRNLITKRRQIYRMTDKYVHCTSCFSMLKESYLRRHERRCLLSKKDEKLKRTVQYTCIEINKKTPEWKRWNKKHYCKYCLEPIVKLPRHLELRHSKELDVVMFLALPKGSLQRREAIDKIRNEGDYLHNQEVLSENKGLLITKRLNGIETSTSGEDNYIPCPKCFSMLKKNYLHRHLKRCSQSKESVEGTVSEETPSTVTAGKTLRQNCKFCSKFVTNIARHLKLRHSEEPEVVRFFSLPKMSAEKREILNNIRKQNSNDPRSEVSNKSTNNMAVVQADTEGLNLSDVGLCTAQNIQTNKVASSRKQSCKFCLKYVTNLSRHLKLMHSVEQEVIKFLALPAESAERREMLNNIRKEGIDRQNCKVQNEEIEESEGIEMDVEPMVEEDEVHSIDEEFNTEDPKTWKKWNKQNCCKFCEKCVQKLPRHLEQHHSAEPEVAEFLLLPKGSIGRRMAIDKIRNDGNFTHNQKVLAESKGNLIMKRRKTYVQSKTDLDNEYVTCPNCRSFLTKEYYPRHRKHCAPTSDENQCSLEQRSETASANKWIRKQTCKFCRKCVKNVAQHLESDHPREPEVRKFLSLPKTSVRRRRLLWRIRKDGNAIRSKSVTLRDNCKSTQLDERLYKTCPNCFCVFNVGYYYKHKKSCLPAGVSETDNSKNANEVERARKEGDSNVVKKKKWGKRHSCKFCLKCVQKLARHLESKHKEEPEVTQFLSLPMGSPQRRNAINRIRNEGNYIHNQEVVTEKIGEFIPKRSKHVGGNVADHINEYKPCPKCYTMLKSKYLNRHLKRCSLIKVEEVCPAPTLEVDAIKPKRKKTWDKKQSCKFCLNLVVKLPRHLESKHSSEPQVAQLLSFPQGSLERRAILEKIRNEGNLVNSQAALTNENGGHVIPKRRKLQNDNAGDENVKYVPCSNCFSMLKEKYVQKHEKYFCLFRKVSFKSDTLENRRENDVVVVTTEQKNIENLEPKNIENYEPQNGGCGESFTSVISASNSTDNYESNILSSSVADAVFYNLHNL